jgi:hypothetical protein
MPNAKAVKLEREVEEEIQHQIIADLGRGAKVRDFMYVQDSKGGIRLNYSFKAQPLFKLSSPYRFERFIPDAKKLENMRKYSRKTLGAC